VLLRQINSADAPLRHDRHPSSVKRAAEMKLRMLFASAAVALVTSLAGNVQAGVLLLHAPNVTLGEGGPYSSLGQQQFADSFSLAGGGVINQVTFWGGAYANTAFGPFTVSFFADESGLPGAQLASATGSPTTVVVGPDDGYGASQPLNQFTLNIPNFNAAAGVTYWFSAAENGPYNFVWTPSDLLHDAAYEFTGGSWTTNPVGPRDSQAFQLSNVAGDVPGGVPEPAAWALLIGGFGLTGVALRRRRALVPA
jgi:hypothetical protein